MDLVESVAAARAEGKLVDDGRAFAGQEVVKVDVWEGQSGDRGRG